MKKIANILILAFALCLSACQNDGNIGDLFGTWRVDEYSKDGVKQERDIINTTTFSFENNIVCVVALPDEHQSYYEQFGTWEENGDKFTFDFTHSDELNSVGDGIYAAPSWLGMTSAEPMVMTIDQRSSSDITLRWISPDGATHVYKLHKTW